MAGEIWEMGIYLYVSDNGTTYTLGVSDPNASAGGFGAAPGGSVINYPKPWRTRHVWGFHEDNTNGSSRHKLPVATRTTGVFVNGTQFTITYLLGAANFLIFGRIGEKRPNRI